MVEIYIAGAERELHNSPSTSDPHSSSGKMAPIFTVQDAGRIMYEGC